MADLAAKATMLIRRPRTEVFDAFVQPQLITKFWLKSTTGPLAAGVQVGGISWCRELRRRSLCSGSTSHKG